MKKIHKIILTAAILFGLPFLGLAATLPGNQGGTGFATTTAGNIGNCLQVAGASPLTWLLGSCGGGSGNSAWTIGLGFIYNASTTDNVGIGLTSPAFKLEVAGTASTTNLNVAVNTKLATTTTGQLLGTDANNFIRSVGLATGTAGNIFNISTSTSQITINCPVASASVQGCLQSADWTTFNNKQAALSSSKFDYLARWTSASAIGTGVSIDNGTVAGVNATSSTVSFLVQGASNVTPLQVSSSTGVSLLQVHRNGSLSVGTTTNASTLYVQGTSTLPAVNLFTLASSSGANLFTVLNNGNVGIATSAPGQTLTVIGTPQFTGLTNCIWLGSINTGIGECGTRSENTDILSWNVIPDATGNVYFEPFQVTASAVPAAVPFFLDGNYSFLDSGTKVCLYGKTQLPKNFSTTTIPTFSPVWTASTTSGNIVWEIAYRDVGGDDTTVLNSTTAQVTASTTDAAPTAVFNRLTPTINASTTILNRGDTLQYRFCRDGADASDTMAATATLQSLLFNYDK